MFLQYICATATSSQSAPYAASATAAATIIVTAIVTSVATAAAVSSYLCRPRLCELSWSSLQWFIMCCWCGCHMKTRYFNMEYTDNSMYTNTEVEFYSLTYPINFWRPLSAFTQCLCNVLIISFFVFTCVVPSFSTFVAAFSAICWTRYSIMEYTDNVMYTNTEIAIVSLTYPIDF